MRALIQRTSGARVEIDGRVAGEIGPGLVVLVCAMRDDDDAQSALLARKVVNLRVFRDAEGRMNRSLLDVGGEGELADDQRRAAETRATVRASRPRRHPRRAGGSTGSSRPGSPATASRSPTASSAPRCSCISSTTARRRSGSTRASTEAGRALGPREDDGRPQPGHGARAGRLSPRPS